MSEKSQKAVELMIHQVINLSINHTGTKSDIGENLLGSANKPGHKKIEIMEDKFY